MATKLKICSFNLRMPNPIDGANYFPNRKERVLACIKEEDPDIIGFQEATVAISDWLREVLDGYIVIGCGRGKDLDDESSLIAYRKNAFEMVSAETFWLSQTPSVPGSRYNDRDQSKNPRVATAAVLKHRQSPEWFLFINTHLDYLTPAVRLYGMNQIMQYIDKMNLPFILTGDMNATPEEPAMEALLTCEKFGAKDLTALTGGTFHNFGRIEEEKMGKIDYVFSNLPGDPKEGYAVKDTPVEGIYISDHLPVMAFVTLA